MHDDNLGTLIEWAPERARASGLRSAAAGDRVEIEGAGAAFVVALEREEVLLAPLCRNAAPPGTAVRRAGPMEVPAGESLIGRSLGPLGEPQDGGGALASGARPVPLWPRGPGFLFPVERRRLTTGLWAYDLKQDIRLGSSVLASGKTHAILRHVLHHQAHEGRIAILALLAASPVGRLASEGLSVIDSKRTPPGPSNGARSTWIILEPGSEGTPGSVWLLPWTALAIADFFRRQGRDAVVALDSLDRWHAAAAAFPHLGSWTTQVGRLFGCPGSTGSGSASLVALASPGLSRPLLSMADAELDFGRALLGGLRPDGTKLVRPPLKVENKGRFGKPVVALAWLEEVERDLPWVLTSPGNLEARDREYADYAFRVREALRFRLNLTVDLAEGLAALVAVMELSSLPASAVPAFMGRFLERARADPAGVLAGVRERREYREADHAALMELARAVEREGVPSPGPPPPPPPPPAPAPRSWWSRLFPG